MKDRQKTKDNHFVPQFYLKQFLNKNGCLYCYDSINKKNFSCTNIKEVCKKKNLYLIKNKISILDKCIFIKFMKNLDSVDKDFCDLLVEMLNDTTGNLFSIKIKGNKKIEEEINTLRQKSLNNNDYSRKQETLFCYIEDNFQSLYAKIIENENIDNTNKENENLKMYLYAKVLRFIHQELFNDLKNIIESENKEKSKNLLKLNLLNNTKENIPLFDIMYYMLTQYFRTQKVFNEIKEALNTHEEKMQLFINKEFPNEKFDINNLIFLFINIKPILLLNSMFNYKFHLLLLKNNTYTPFLTSDNPCINTYADSNKKKNNKKYTFDELELYFPLTPTLALLLTKNQNISKEIEDVRVIKEYNLKIIKNAERYVFANYDKLLEIYIGNFFTH